MTNHTDTVTDDEMRLQLNQETAQMPWRELQRWFASGNMIAVGDALDLIDVAVRIARDDVSALRNWMDQGLVGRVSDEQARSWLLADAAPWTVVVKPWILVQLRRS